MPITLSQIAEVAHDEAKAYELLEANFWPHGPVCPHCGTINHAYLIQPKLGARKTKAGNWSYRRLWQCGSCRKQFSVLVGTIFEDSKIPVWKWLMAFYLMNANKNGVSAHEMHRELGITYKSAWFMMHRIREAMSAGKFAPRLSGTVEMDETYIGGHKKGQKGGRQLLNKTIVFALVQRDGEVRTQPSRTVTAKTIRTIIKEHVNPDAHLMTDTYVSYKHVIPGRDGIATHDFIDHSAGEYVRASVHINTAEGYFSQLKRSLDGTYHHVSEKHLHRYLAEFDHRYNTRKDDDGERTVKAIRKSAGKRLMYRRTISPPEER